MPDQETIDRAYVRSRPPPDAGRDGYKKLVTGSTTLGAGLVVTLALIFAALAAADNLLGLRWGYHWRDVWGALGMAAFGVVLYGLCRAWFTFIGFYDLGHRKDVR